MDYCELVKEKNQTTGVKLWFCLMEAKHPQEKQTYDVLDFQLASPVLKLKKILKKTVLEIAKF